MYLSGWIGLVAISLWVSLVAFAWALLSGQFSDQKRARYLALRSDMRETPAKPPPKFTAEALALLVIIMLGLAALAASAALSLYWMNR